MQSFPRYLENVVPNDALSDRKIAFISGPRQVGKTHLASRILSQAGDEAKAGYYNWDDDEFKKIWIQNPKILFHQKNIVVLDEIHKDRAWKSKLKGLYDLFKDKTKIIVTGSARLDFYRKSGDSLQGRYYPYRLHPMSLNESGHIPLPPSENTWGGELKCHFDLDPLLELGGFPDPLFGQSAAKAQRWRRLYRERMIREDLRDLREVKDLEALKVLSLLLEGTVSSRLSYESLRQDLKLSFDTVKTWVELLESVYFCYRIRPYSKGLKQSLRKEPKLYLFDWSLLKEEGPRFENFIASHLLKSCHAWTDSAQGEFELCYIRDKQKREVDFLVTKNAKPWLLVEVKNQSSTISKELLYYSDLLRPRYAIQVVRSIHKERHSLAHPGIEVMDARRFLSRLV